jgi:hypothetical protein
MHVMALYREKQFLDHIEDTEANLYFDTDHQPGERAPVAGIYRCIGCGREIGTAANHTLPTQHLAGPESHPVRWRLVAFADHRSDADRTANMGLFWLLE